MVSTSSCTIGIKLQSICHKTTCSQEIGQINFDIRSERERLLLTLRTQVEETSLSHQICNVARKICRFIPTTEETTKRYG